MTRPAEWARLPRLILVYVFVGAVALLLVVTRLASRRDAARKAEIARKTQAKDDGRD